MTDEWKPASPRRRSMRQAGSVWPGSLWLAVPAIVFIGCGDDSTVQAVPVSGVVTYQGRPVAGATVTFTPQQSSGRPWPGTATTDGEGKFELHTPGLGAGAVPARHAVSITARGPARPLDPDSPFAQLGDGAQAYAARGEPLIPQKYFSPKTSGLTAAVTSDGDNVFEFHLAE